VFLAGFTPILVLGEKHRPPILKGKQRNACKQKPDSKSAKLDENSIFFALRMPNHNCSHKTQGPGKVFRHTLITSAPPGQKIKRGRAFKKGNNGKKRGAYGFPNGLSWISTGRPGAGKGGGHYRVDGGAGATRVPQKKNKIRGTRAAVGGGNKLFYKGLGNAKHTLGGCLGARCTLDVLISGRNFSRRWGGTRRKKQSGAWHAGAKSTSCPLGTNFRHTHGGDPEGGPKRFVGGKRVSGPIIVRKLSNLHPSLKSLGGPGVGGLGPKRDR